MVIAALQFEAEGLLDLQVPFITKLGLQLLNVNFTLAKHEAKRCMNAVTTSCDLL